MTEEIDSILAYWFGELNEAGFPREDRRRLWFTKSAVTDQEIRERFGDLVTRALAGELDHWLELDRGRVALILLLDQFTRNIYRDTPAAFSGDTPALTLAREAIAAGQHQRLPAIHQVFLGMPLEHAEDLEAQEACVALFAELESLTGEPALTDFRQYAEAHRDVIAHFGRFPHRNPILGRESTDAELAWLREHGGF